MLSPVSHFSTIQCLELLSIWFFMFYSFINYDCQCETSKFLDNCNKWLEKELPILGGKKRFGFRWNIWKRRKR